MDNNVMERILDLLRFVLLDFLFFCPLVGQHQSNQMWGSYMSPLALQTLNCVQVTVLAARFLKPHKKLSPICSE